MDAVGVEAVGDGGEDVGIELFVVSGGAFVDGNYGGDEEEDAEKEEVVELVVWPVFEDEECLKNQEDKTGDERDDHEPVGAIIGDVVH